MNASPEKGGTPSKKGKGPTIVNGTGNSLNLAPPMERMDSMQSQGNASQTDKDEGVGMMSPESLEQR